MTELSTERVSLEIPEIEALRGSLGRAAYSVDSHALIAAVECIIAARVTEAKAELIDTLRTAFSGDEFEENAATASQEGEWSWFRWLITDTALRPGGES